MSSSNHPLVDNDQEAVPHALVADLHTPKPWIFWSDLLSSALLGWTAFAVAVVWVNQPAVMLPALLLAAFGLYRGVCFTHELAHLRRRTLPGFETTWNLLFGLPLLLPSFTYIGVHQSHHSLSTYGTKDDPEYLPLARSRGMLTIFTIQSTLLLPLLLVIRFLILAPIGLALPRFHRWLEAHASSFSMNPAYRRETSPETASKIRRWEASVLLFWSVPIALAATGALTNASFGVWIAVLVIISFLNTVRVLGAHEYESDGSPRTRFGQLTDSIDTPGGPWTELWAPVGLRYHALHHYFPGIPYHNLGPAYRRIVKRAPATDTYLESTSPSLQRSLRTLYGKARRAGIAPSGSAFRKPAA